jgi:membrane protein insertase Oxa1/YidC/SpoIIIJ
MRPFSYFGRRHSDKSVDSQESIAAATDVNCRRSGWDPTWYNIADQCIAHNKFPGVTGVEYGWAIVGVTVMRLCLFPVMVSTQQTTCMAHVQPELQAIKLRYASCVTPRVRNNNFFQANEGSVYQVQSRCFEPFRRSPLIQLPLFMGMFFGLKDAGTVSKNGQRWNALVST